MLKLVDKHYGQVFAFWLTLGPFPYTHMHWDSALITRQEKQRLYISQHTWNEARDAMEKLKERTCWNGETLISCHTLPGGGNKSGQKTDRRN